MGNIIRKNNESTKKKINNLQFKLDDNIYQINFGNPYDVCPFVKFFNLKNRTYQDIYKFSSDLLCIDRSNLSTDTIQKISNLNLKLYKNNNLTQDEIKFINELEINESYDFLDFLYFITSEDDYSFYITDEKQNIVSVIGLILEDNDFIRNYLKINNYKNTDKIYSLYYYTVPEYQKKGILKNGLNKIIKHFIKSNKLKVLIYAHFKNKGSIKLLDKFSKKTFYRYDFHNFLIDKELNKDIEITNDASFDYNTKLTFFKYGIIN